MISLPPHCTHKMQPLGIGCFRPLKLYYNRAADVWMRTNPGKAISVYEIPAMLNEAFNKASVVGNAVNAFRKAGLYPPDRYVFSEEDFAATLIASEEPGSTAQELQGERSPEGRMPEDSAQVSPTERNATDDLQQPSEEVQVSPKSTPPESGSSNKASMDEGMYSQILKGGG